MVERETGSKAPSTNHPVNFVYRLGSFQPAAPWSAPRNGPSAPRATTTCLA